MKPTLKHLILFIVIIAVSCSQRDTGFTGGLTPHQTDPYLIYDLNTIDLPTDQFTVYWHRGHTGDKTIPGSTLDLPDEPLLCNTLDDVNRHVAWVRQNTRPILEKAADAAGVSPSKAGMMIPMVEKHMMRYFEGVNRIPETR